MKSGLSYCVICIISFTEVLLANKTCYIEMKPEVGNLTLYRRSADRFI